MIGIEIEEYFWLRKKMARKLHAPQVIKKAKKQYFLKESISKFQYSEV